jgi:hypothetical protein
MPLFSFFNKVEFPTRANAHNTIIKVTTFIIGTYFAYHMFCKKTPPPPEVKLNLDKLIADPDPGPFLDRYSGKINWDIPSAIAERKARMAAQEQSNRVLLEKEATN